MKRVGMFVWLMVAGIAAHAAETESFTVTLPNGFAPFQQVRSQAGKVPQGKIETVNYVSKSPIGEAVVVTISRMPARLGSPGSLLSGIRDSLLKAFSATLEKEQNLPGPRPASGLLFKGNAERPLFYRAHVMVDGNTIYQLIYVGRSTQQRTAAPIARVFETFRIK